MELRVLQQRRVPHRGIWALPLRRPLAATHAAATLAAMLRRCRAGKAALRGSSGPPGAVGHGDNDGETARSRHGHPGEYGAHLGGGGGMEPYGPLLTGMDRYGLVWNGMDRYGMVWTGMERYGPV